MTAPFTPETLAAHWGVSASSIRSRCNAGHLPHFRFGKLYRIPANVVEEIEACQISASDDSVEDSVSTGKRTRHQLEARTRADAEAEAIDVYRRVSFTSAPKGLTVAEIWKLYQHDLAGRPTGRKLPSFGRQVLPHFGHYRPDQITTEMCRAYNGARTAKGATR